MAKRMTKAQYKRALLAIKQKAQKCFLNVGMGSPLSSKDYMAIERIVDNKLKRLKEL